MNFVKIKQTWNIWIFNHIANAQERLCKQFKKYHVSSIFIRQNDNKGYINYTHLTLSEISWLFETDLGTDVVKIWISGMLIHIRREKCSSFSDLEFVEVEIHSLQLLTVSMKSEIVPPMQWLANFYYSTAFNLVLPSSTIMPNELSTYNPGLSTRACQTETRGRVRFAWISN